MSRQCRGLSFNHLRDASKLPIPMLPHGTRQWVIQAAVGKDENDPPAACGISSLLNGIENRDVVIIIEIIVAVLERFDRFDQI